MPDLLIYGSYPEVVSAHSYEDKRDALKELALPVGNAVSYGDLEGFVP